MKRCRILHLQFLAVILTAVILVRCESNERFYRPDLLEKLCCIGIIDANDTASFSPRNPYTFNNCFRYISFEKSFQSEYSEEVNDSLREFTFSISTPDKEIFSLKEESTMDNLQGFIIPDSIEFHNGEKYFLRASEKSTPEISAEVTVPEAPENLTLISVSKEITPLSERLKCTDFNTINSAVISVSFTNYSEQKLFYCILLEGCGHSMWHFPHFKTGFLDFSVRECNSPGFFSVIQGQSLTHFYCIHDSNLDYYHFSAEDSPVSAYFIEGSKIPDNKCFITISTQFHDSFSFFDGFRSFRIKILSIPEELFLFEKSLYTYTKVSEDPYSEPVYLNGNITEGNGVFAICGSSELIINLSPWY